LEVKSSKTWAGAPFCSEIFFVPKWSEENFDKMGIIGHQKILEFLNKSLKTNKISHAYLFVGPEHLGKKKVAIEFAKALQCEKDSENGFQKRPKIPSEDFGTRQASSLPSPSFVNETGAGTMPARRLERFESHISSSFTNCNQCRSCQEIDKNQHPDVLLIEPEIIEKKGAKKEQEISIGKIREIQHQLSLFPYRGPYKIVIIDSAHKMTKEAANALLKTLEEPTKNTVLILISSAPQFLLPTVISRCLLIKFLPVPKTVIRNQLLAISSQPPDLLDKIIRLAGGRPGLVIDYLTNPDLVKKQNQILEDLFSLLKKDLNFRFQYAENLSKDINLAHQILGQWLIFFRDLMLYQIGCGDLAINLLFPERASKVNRPFDSAPMAPHSGNTFPLIRLKNILKEIIKTDQILNNSSFNSRLALEVLMLEL